MTIDPQEQAAGQPTPTDRPTDEAIVQQANALRAEAACVPYVGNKESLDALKKEYEAGSAVFVRKIEKLEQRYSGLRRTRGDGNCFFRAFIFAYLEHLLLSGDKTECNRFSGVIQGWRPKLVEAGIQELVFEDAMDLLLEHVSNIVNGSLGPDALLDAYRDDCASNMVVMLLRLIVSAEVTRREDFFLPFILGMYDDPPASVEMFCERHVQPMAEEADNIHIVALTDALQVPVAVVYLDRSGAAGLGGAGGFEGGEGDDLDINTHTFVPEACAGAQPRVHVLYRPGHYDIVYPLQQQ